MAVMIRSVGVAALVGIFALCGLGPATAATYYISGFYTSDAVIGLGGCGTSGDMTTYWIHAYEAFGDKSGDVGTRGVYGGYEMSITWDAVELTQHYPNYEVRIDKYKLYHY